MRLHIFHLTPTQSRINYFILFLQKKYSHYNVAVPVESLL